MKTNIIVLVALSLTVLFGCKSLPEYESRWEPIEDQDFMFTGFDLDNKIYYTITNDSTHLYITFKTEDQYAQQKILFMGTRVLIDTSAKKKEAFFISYPQKRVASREGRNRPRGGGDRNSRMLVDQGERLKKMVSMLSVDGQFHMYDSLGSFYAKSDSSEIFAEITSDASAMMFYSLKIPLDIIYPDGGNYFDKVISIGLVTETPEMTGGASGSSEPGMRGGGGRSGGGGRPGGKSGGSNMAAMQKMMEPVNIWFKLNIANKTNKAL